MAYSIISSEKTNTGNLYHFKGTSSDTKPTGKWVGENSEFIELDTGDTYFYDNPTAGWVKKVGDSGGSSSGGSYTLPTASADTKGGVKIGSGLTMTGEVLSATGGGGAEKFVVTITEVADPGEDAYYTADKTISEILEANGDGKIIVGMAEENGLTWEIPCIAPVNTEEAKGAIFAGIFTIGDYVNTLAFVGLTQDGSDVWQRYNIPNNPLPDYSSSNNGQVLGVSSGDLTWVDNYAPLIVTLTLNNEALVGDKTYSEVKTAIHAGRNVVITVSNVFGIDDMDIPVLACVTGDSGGGTTYTLKLVLDESIGELTGGASDYVTVTLH